MRTKASLQQWQELYDLTLKIKEIEPWNYLWDTDITRILLPDKKEPYFISVLGKGGNTYGIIVYSGYEAFNSFVDLTNSDKLGIPTLYAMYEQDNLTCYFGDREEVSKEQYQVIHELGLRFRGRNQWPYFLSMKPYYYPFIPDQAEVETLLEVYRELIPLFDAVFSNEVQINFSKGETVTRFYDQNEQKWKYEVAEMEYKPKSYITFNIEADEQIKQLNSLPNNNATIEIDMNYMNSAINEPGFDRPVYPKILAIVNQNSGMIINQKLITPDMNEAETIVDTLLDYLSRYNRPKAIQFRLPVIGYLLKEFCQKIQIPCIQMKRLRASDAFFKELMNHFR